MLLRTLINFDPARPNAGEPSTLGYTICQNLLRDALKSKGSQIRNVLLGGLGWVASQVGDGETEPSAASQRAGDDPFLAAICNEKTQRVREAIQALSPELREVVNLVLLNGSTVKQAALDLGVCSATASRRLTAAKAQLGIVLQDQD